MVAMRHELDQVKEELGGVKEGVKDLKQQSQEMLNLLQHRRRRVGTSSRHRKGQSFSRESSTDRNFRE